MSKKYYVDGIVCDYGVFYPNEPENELICLCNLKSNAELIAAILNADNEEVSTCWRDKKLDELYQQLTEKDEEIERLKVSENWYREQYNDICKRCEDYNKNLRHRVVEQFKEKYRNVANYLTGHCTEAQLIEVLDQIEKGE